jgi:hypothetical protein
VWLSLEKVYIMKVNTGTQYGGVPWKDNWKLFYTLSVHPLPSTTGKQCIYDGQINLQQFLTFLYSVQAFSMPTSESKHPGDAIEDCMQIRRTKHCCCAGSRWDNLSFRSISDSRIWTVVRVYTEPVAEAGDRPRCSASAGQRHDG